MQPGHFQEKEDIQADSTRVIATTTWGEAGPPGTILECREDYTKARKDLCQCRCHLLHHGISRLTIVPIALGWPFIGIL